MKGMWIILLSPVPERYFFLSFVMYFLACLLLLLFFCCCCRCLFVFFFTYSLFVFLSFQLSLEELLFVYPGPGCSKLG